MKFIKVVLVPSEEAWECEGCEEERVIAYVAIPGVEQTFGYGRNCLGKTVVAEVDEFNNQILMSAARPRRSAASSSAGRNTAARMCQR
jgi:hypothetical protein